jgi:hypothetical protein
LDLVGSNFLGNSWVKSWSVARREWIVKIENGRPPEPDARQVGGEHILPRGLDASLDPRHEVVERLPAAAVKGIYDLFFI